MTLKAEAWQDRIFIQVLYFAVLCLEVHSAQ